MSAYGLVYPFPGKGHDRVYINEADGLYGVFDGANGAQLSRAIVAALPGCIVVYNRRCRGRPRPGYFYGKPGGGYALFATRSGSA
jgi:hypothetical protein